MARDVDPVRTVSQIDYAWIELRDGARLAARIWLPDDVHYKGGCLLGTDLLHWSSCMLHWHCQPPHELAVGAGWRDLWRLRLESNEPWVHTWLAHQRRDDHWKHDSV